MDCGGKGPGAEASAGFEDGGDSGRVGAVTGSVNKSVEREDLVVSTGGGGGAYRVGP